MEQAWTVTSGQPSTAWSDDSSGRDMIPQADPVIVADNQLPAEYGREFTEIDFSYENPTVARVAHPGPAQVKTLSKDSEGTLLSSPNARFNDLGSDFYDTRINPERKKRNHIRALEPAA